MAAQDLIISLIKVFIMLFPVYVLTKFELVNDSFTKNISDIITYVAFPCMVIDAMQMEFSMDIITNCRYIVMIIAVVVVFAILVSRFLSRIFHIPTSRSGILTFMTVFGNTGFIGLPMLGTLFGKEGIFYGSICDSVMGIFMFTIGVIFIKRASNPGNTNKCTKISEIVRLLKDPCFICVFIGIVLYCLRITLPDIIGDSVYTIGSLTGPLAMISVGSHLAGIKFKRILTNRLSYLSSILKLVAVPLIAMLLVKLVIGSNTLFGAVIVMQMAMPSAMLSVILSERYSSDTEFATEGVMLSTILCLITLPIFAVIL